MEDILKEINFNKFDNTQNGKIREKLNRLLQKKYKMDKLVEKNSGYEMDKNSNNILLDNLDSCIKDHLTLSRKIENEADKNLSNLNKMKNISLLFDEINNENCDMKYFEMIKESFNDFNEIENNYLKNLEKLENDEEFNKLINEDFKENNNTNNFDMKISYPESINNGFNFTVSIFLKFFL